MAELRPCPDCERLCELEDNVLCPSCAEFREWKFAQLEDDRLDKIARRKRFRPFGAMSGADFGEALADMVKVVERQQK